LSVMVPVTPLPPVTLLWERLTDETQADPEGFTVNVAVAPAQLPALAVMVAAKLFDPAEVDTLNVAEICPAGTVTLEGT
jgi:hypothetical protein